MDDSLNNSSDLEHSSISSQVNPTFIPPDNQNISPTSINNKHTDGEKILKIILGTLSALVVILVCAILLIRTNTPPQDTGDNETALQNNDEEETKTSSIGNIDCSHSEVDLKSLTGEDNPNVYNATTYLRTDSRYLCIEDWGIALSLPDDINAVIYTPVSDSTADYTSHRMGINAIIDENNNVNWGGNYMPDSYFSTLAVLERAEPEKMDYIKKQYSITDSDDVFLKTDEYTYFVHKTRGRDYVDYFKLLSSRYENGSFNISDAFYDDILLVDSFVSDFNNYHVYDDSKT